MSTKKIKKIKKVSLKPSQVRPLIWTISLLLNDLINGIKGEKLLPHKIKHIDSVLQKTTEVYGDYENSYEWIAHRNKFYLNKLLKILAESNVKKLESNILKFLETVKPFSRKLIASDISSILEIAKERKAELSRATEILKDLGMYSQKQKNRDEKRFGKKLDDLDELIFDYFGTEIDRSLMIACVLDILFGVDQTTLIKINQIMNQAAYSNSPANNPAGLFKTIDKLKVISLR